MLRGLFNVCTFPEHLLSAGNTSGAREGSPLRTLSPGSRFLPAGDLRLLLASSRQAGTHMTPRHVTSRSTPCSPGHVGTALWLVLPGLCPPSQASGTALQFSDSAGLAGVFPLIVSSRLSCRFTHSASCVLAFVS